MTLNNLAGGVTGGVMGISAGLNTLYAFVISVAFMWIGYCVGHASQKHRQQRQQLTEKSGSTTTSNTTTTTTNTASFNLGTISIALYLVLSFQSLYEAMTWRTGD